MTVENETEPAGAPQGQGRIVVGVDGSPGSLAALRWALTEASLRGVNVYAVGSRKFPGGMGGIGMGMGYPMSAEGASPEAVLAAEIEATVAAATAPAPGGEAAAATVTVSAVKGDPATELQRAVGTGDLLVMGSRGHGEVAGLLLGSVSQHVVNRARCPVVVVPNLVRPEDDESA
jgi:nucleotide-binding universal stress UspA family protein